MKKLLLIIPVITITMLFPPAGCSDDKSDDASDYEFKDQDLRGKLAGAAWQCQSGYAEADAFNADQISINIYSEAPAGGDPCGFGAYPFDTDFVMFSAPDTTGLYELGYTDNGKTVTLYAGGVNYIAVEGAVEILSIDTGGNVTGRIDAGADSDNYINGSFSVTFCGN